uniref:Uncharacterized protein n=1 Tax=Dulem virus 40 TaxID=3145758 RepID=A0AAU8AWV4_9CAUD
MSRLTAKPKRLKESACATHVTGIRWLNQLV